MKKIKIIATGLLLTGLTVALMSSRSNETLLKNRVDDSKTGEALFKAKCTTCHITTKPEDMSKLIAPPAMGVMMHVKNGIEAKNEAEKKSKAIAFIVDYVQNPSEEKSLLEKRAIERFGLMPSQKANVTAEELGLIANYMYDNFPPKGMKHGKGEKGGCGMGCGSSCKH